MSNSNSVPEKIKKLKETRGIRKIYFICLGNLCRSPMAEYLCREEMKKKNIAGIEISSGGFLDQTGAHSPEEIHIVMKEAGIDISGHRSSPITEEKIRKSDLIIVMEKRQREDLVCLYPDEASRVFLLSQFDREIPEERDVEDPIGQRLTRYRSCFNEIKYLVEGLVEQII